MHLTTAARPTRPTNLTILGRTLRIATVLSLVVGLTTGCTRQSALVGAGLGAGMAGGGALLVHTHGEKDYGDFMVGYGGIVVGTVLLSGSLIAYLAAVQNEPPRGHDR